MNILVPCPACHKALTARSTAVVSVVCPDCRTVVVKTGSAWVSIRKAQPIPEDMTPLRTGAKGHWKGLAFEVIGRVRSVFDGGYRNAWAISFDDGSSGWLSESYGTYAVYRKAAFQLPASKFVDAKAGKKITFPDGSDYKIDSLDRHLSSTYEGELWEHPYEEGNFIIVELSAEQQQSALVRVHSKLKIVVLVGLFADFDELILTDYRDVRTWL